MQNISRGSVGGHDPLKNGPSWCIHITFFRPAGRTFIWNGTFRWPTNLLFMRSVWLELHTLRLSSHFEGSIIRIAVTIGWNDNNLCRRSYGSMLEERSAEWTVQSKINVHLVAGCNSSIWYEDTVRKKAGHNRLSDRLGQGPGFNCKEEFLEGLIWLLQRKCWRNGTIKGYAKTAIMVVKIFIHMQVHATIPHGVQPCHQTL